MDEMFQYMQNQCTVIYSQASKIDSSPASLPTCPLTLMAGALHVEDQGRQAVLFSR